MKKFYLLAAAALCAATATAANGDWLMLEDFEGATPEMTAFNQGNGNIVDDGTIKIETMEKDGNASNHALQFTPAGSYSHGIQIKATLPAGKTIADYTDIRFDICGVNNYNKPLHLFINGTKVIEDTNNSVVGDQGVWYSRSYAISVSGTGNEITVGFYNHTSNSETIAFDNIQLKEKDGGSGEDPDPDPDPTPGDYDESKNGTVTDGWLMIEDYQTKQPGDEATVGDYMSGNNANGMSAKIVVDPTKATNLVASAKQTNSSWNNLFALDVVLPEGTTLKDYSAIAFDIYRFTAPEGDRPIFVKAGKYEIKPDNPFEQIKTEEWITKEYAISENTQEGNSFKLYFGIKSDNVNYAVDNIRLKAKETPKPELALVGEPKITVKHHTFAGIITVSYSFEVKNYNGEGINVVATVDEHNEVSFVAAEPNNAPARAAGENTTFSGNLKAKHDVLKNISNPNVRLTATAGGKQLFDEAKTPDTTTTTGIEDVTVDSEAPVEYFNLQGLRVAQPEAGQLYIKRQGDKAVKVRF